MQIKTNRIQSIDILRGAVMVIMALDHVRSYTNHGYLYTDPTDLDITTPFLFFTRWITHFCAPVFVFLAGTSAFLYGQNKKSKPQLSKFLFTRGLWLIFIELTVVNLSWTFDIGLSIHIFQVIWAIGLCMIVLSALIHLPYKLLIALGFLLILGHNALDGILFKGNDISSIIWYALHQKSTVVLDQGQSVLLFFYPILPWIGLMILGYCFGKLYQSGFNIQLRKKWLLYLGLGSIILFVILRYLNVYGDLHPWSVQKNSWFTFLSFFNTTKYPPSLLYLLMTIGPSLLFLRGIEGIKNKFTSSMVVIGRVPFFYYVIHLYVIHVIGILGLLVQGVSWKELILTPVRFNSGLLMQYGFDLWVTYLVWIAVVVLLYPVCKKYMLYKKNNKDKWWLSYL
jgi:uncharacterized membrane protein